MDQLQAMRVFVRVAERNSFSAVARELGSTQSQISRQVAQLEEKLGAALLTRTTRQVQLTPEGRSYLDYARRALQEVDEGEALLRGERQTLSGRLRVATATGLYHYLVFPALQRLMAQHPALSVDVMLSDAQVDLVTEGADLAVRAGELGDSSLVARKLIDVQRWVVATPAYLAASADTRPAIVVPQALAQHDCCVPLYSPDSRWHFHDEQDRQISVPVSGRWRIGQVLATRELVLASHCVALVPDFLVADAVQDGRLVRLLPAYRAKGFSVHAVYPASRRQVARVEALVQMLLAQLQPAASPQE